VQKQFFPTSDRPEVLIDIRLPEGSAIRATAAVVERVEAILAEAPGVRSSAAYLGAGAPRFFLALNPEFPNPAFAKLIVVAEGAAERDALIAQLQAHVEAGEFPEARVRVHKLLYGPPVIWPVTFRVVGPDPLVLRGSPSRCAMWSPPIRIRWTRIWTGASASPWCGLRSTRSGCV
jgi:multidrug efflux pump subunit AcrB